MSGVRWYLDKAATCAVRSPSTTLLRTTKAQASRPPPLIPATVGGWAGAGKSASVFPCPRLPVIVRRLISSFAPGN